MKKYLTLVFRADDIDIEMRSGLAQIARAMSWSHAIDDREEVEQERDKLKEQLAELQRWLSTGIFYRLDELAKHDIEVIEQFVAAIIQCIKAVDPKIEKHKNCLSIAELKSFNIQAKNTGVSGIKGYANQLRQKAQETQK